MTTTGLARQREDCTFERLGFTPRRRAAELVSGGAMTNGVKALAARVNRVHREATDIASFELISADSRPLPAYSPGSHIDVHLGPNLVRQYSLCGEPDRYVIAVKREAQSRGGSAAMHEQIKEGDVLTISEPRNTFALDRSAKHHTLIAGGIGVTPLLSMARHLLASGAEFNLNYFTRSPEHTAFHAILSAPGFAQRWISTTPSNRTAYARICAACFGSGPRTGTCICAVRDYLWMWSKRSRRRLGRRIRSIWSTSPWIRDRLPDRKTPFDVRLARSGGTYAIPAGRSIVSVLAQNGIAVEVSCEQGVCGICLTGVLEGVPDHRDMYLTEAEHRAGDKMTVCVSRAQSALLVLDL